MFKGGGVEKVEEGRGRGKNTSKKTRDKKKKLAVEEKRSLLFHPQRGALSTRSTFDFHLGTKERSRACAFLDAGKLTRALESRSRG